MIRIVLLLALAACFRAAPAPAPANTAAPAPAPRTAAPEVRHDATGFATTGLPAIARDGHRVVLAQIDADGARGHRNLQIVVKNRRNADLERFVVLTVDEQDLLDEEMQATPELRTRIEAANRRLRAIHADHALVPLTALATDVNRTAPADVTHATGAGLAIAWSITGHLEIRSQGVLVVERDEPGWLAAPRRSGCTNAAYVDAAYAAPGEELVVLEIGYRGDDACWEPDDQLHVVAW